MHGCRPLWIVLALGLGSGCQVGRKTFQYDSNSRTPFFGIDLLGDQTKPKAKAHVAETPREATVLPVKQAAPPPARKDPGLLEKLGLKRSPEWIPLTLSDPESSGEDSTP